MKRSILLLMLLPLLFVSGCRENTNPYILGYNGDNGPAEISEPLAACTENVMYKPAPKREIQVWYNCLTVQMAVEEFAAQNRGIYPGNVASDRNLAGNTVVDLLPAGALLYNPFTRLRSEPMDGFAATPGMVGYAYAAKNGFILGYSITGFGKDRVIATIAKYPGYYYEGYDEPEPDPR